MLVQEVLLEGVAGDVEHPPAEEAGVALPAVVLHHPPHEIVHLAEQSRILRMFRVSVTFRHRIGEITFTMKGKS